MNNLKIENDKSNLVWENNNRGFFKDTSGTVWQIVRTSYNEIPIVIFNPQDGKNEEKTLFSEVKK